MIKKVFTDLLEKNGIEISHEERLFLAWISGWDKDTEEMLVSLLKKCIGA